MPRTALADLVLLLHLAYVGFVTFGFVAIPAGALWGWGWVRNRTFRLLHAAAIGLVAVEAVAGWICPLTRLEAWLRGRWAAGSFMGRLLQAVLYYDAPPWVFTAAYVALAALAGLLWLWVRPRPQHR